MTHEESYGYATIKKIYKKDNTFNTFNNEGDF